MRAYWPLCGLSEATVVGPDRNEGHCRSASRIPASRFSRAFKPSLRLCRIIDAMRPLVLSHDLPERLAPRFQHWQPQLPHPPRAADAFAQASTTFCDERLTTRCSEDRKSIAEDLCTIAPSECRRSVLWSNLASVEIVLDATIVTPQLHSRQTD